MKKDLSFEDFKELKISIVDPLSEFLQGNQEESRFDLSLLDIVHFAGHACPSMIGAFLIAQKVVQEFFPETNVCIRGEISVDFPTAIDQGATGPISNVFGFIFGCWGESGFGGLKGQFARRGLTRYSRSEVPQGCFRFHHLASGRSLDISYQPGLIQIEADPELPFQQLWRKKIKAILKDPEKVISVKRLDSAMTRIITAGPGLP